MGHSRAGPQQEHWASHCSGNFSSPGPQLALQVPPFVLQMGWGEQPAVEMLYTNLSLLIFDKKNMIARLLVLFSLYILRVV